MEGLVYLDGAMGTQLQAMGLGPGEIPELCTVQKMGAQNSIPFRKEINL